MWLKLIAEIIVGNGLLVQKLDIKNALFKCKAISRRERSRMIIIICGNPKAMHIGPNIIENRNGPRHAIMSTTVGLGKLEELLLGEDPILAPVPAKKGVPPDVLLARMDKLGPTS